MSVVVLSHPHPDHFIGLRSVVPGLGLDAFWDTGQGERDGAGPVYQQLVDGVRARGIRIARPREVCGRVHAFGGAALRVLGPCPDIGGGHHANDNSFVFHIRFGERSALLVGDAEHAQEAELLAVDRSRLRADLLKIGHHGSRTSSSPRFLDAVRPSVAVITSGVRNRYGHPASETLHSLHERGIRVLRSDRHGAVQWTTNGKEVTIRSALDGR